MERGKGGRGGRRDEGRVERGKEGEGREKGKEVAQPSFEGTILLVGCGACSLGKFLKLVCLKTYLLDLK